MRLAKLRGETAETSTEEVVRSGNTVGMSIPAPGALHPILKTDSPMASRSKSLAWSDGAGGGSEESKSKTIDSPDDRPDSSSRPSRSRSNSPTPGVSTTAHIARVDKGFPRRGRSDSSPANSTWSISETNNPLVDRLINELRRLLKFQQKETAAAKAKNAEMNTLLFERNEFVRVTIASLKKEESHAAFLQEEIRRLKTGGGARADDFESLRAELVRLNDVSIRLESQLRGRDEQSAALQEQLAAAQDAASAQRALTPSGARAKDDPEGWLRRQFQMDHAASAEDDVDQSKVPQQGGLGAVPEGERLMLLATKLKALLGTVSAAVSSSSASTAGPEQEEGEGGGVVGGGQEEGQGDPPLDEPETYCSQLLALFDEGRGEAARPDSPLLNRARQRSRASSPAMSDRPDSSLLLDDEQVQQAMQAAIERAVAAKDEELRRMAADYEQKLALVKGSRPMSPDQQAALNAVDLQRRVDDLERLLQESRSETEAAHAENTSIKGELASLDESLEARKREIGAIEVMLSTLEGRLGEEMMTSAQLSSSLEQQTAALGAANDHIAKLVGEHERFVAEAEAAANLAASTIATHLASIAENLQTIKTREGRITTLEQEAVRAAQAAAKAMTLKIREMESMESRLSRDVATRDDKIRSLLDQID